MDVLTIASLVTAGTTGLFYGFSKLKNYYYGSTIDPSQIFPPYDYDYDLSDTPVTCQELPTPHHVIPEFTFDTAKWLYSLCQLSINSSSSHNFHHVLFLESFETSVGRVYINDKYVIIVMIPQGYTTVGSVGSQATVGTVVSDEKSEGHRTTEGSQATTKEFSTSYKDFGNVNGIFLNTFCQTQIYHRMMSIVEKYCTTHPRQLIVTGYGSGGCLATLASVYLADKGYHPIVYTFGMIPFSSPKFNETAERLVQHSYHVVNGNVSDNNKVYPGHVIIFNDIVHNNKSFYNYFYQ